MAEKEWGIRIEISRSVRASTYEEANRRKDRIVERVERTLRAGRGFRRADFTAGPAEEFE